MSRTFGFLLTFALGAFLLAAASEVLALEHSMAVTATAYNSLPSQTDSNPSIGAWGDRLEPGMKTVAVSRDLLEKGLSKGAVLRIEGLKGEYVVLDKMGSRHKQRIDIYMGTDVRRARDFGVQKVRIYWSD